VTKKKYVTDSSFNGTKAKVTQYETRQAKCKTETIVAVENKKVLHLRERVCGGRGGVG
jgi:hypothetical protein